ncbi:MAG: ribonuclease P protein component [Candidatus Margulisiibacteriota bacterium]
MSELFIKEQRDFNRIIKTGIQLNTPIGRMKFLKKGVLSPKLGIILGKTQGLTAVKRNRIRRIIKEAWKRVSQKLSIPVELVIFPMNKIFGLKSTKIEELLLHCFGKGF